MDYWGEYGTKGGIWTIWENIVQKGGIWTIGENKAKQHEFGDLYYVITQRGVV